MIKFVVEVVLAIFLHPIAFVLCVIDIVNRADLAEPRSGPCIIEEYDSTCVVPPGSTANLDPFGNIVIELRAPLP